MAFKAIAYLFQNQPVWMVVCVRVYTRSSRFTITMSEMEIVEWTLLKTTILMINRHHWMQMCYSVLSFYVAFILDWILFYFELFYDESCDFNADFY